MPNDNEKAVSAREADLARELSRILAELSGTESDAEVEKALERVKELKDEYADSGRAGARAEELIALAREKLEKLREYTARKRRVQEGELMRRKARREEDAASEFAVAAAITAGAAAVSAAKHEEEEDAEAEADKPELPASAPKKKAAPQSGAMPAQHAGEAEWNRAYRLTAHLAQSFLEDGSYFEKLRRSATVPGPRRTPPDNCTKIRVFSTRIFFCLKCLKLNDHKAFLKLRVSTWINLRSLKTRCVAHRLHTGSEQVFLLQWKSFLAYGATLLHTF